MAGQPEPVSGTLNSASSSSLSFPSTARDQETIRNGDGLAVASVLSEPELHNGLPRLRIHETPSQPLLPPSTQNGQPDGPPLRLDRLGRVSRPQDPGAQLPDARQWYGPPPAPPRPWGPIDPVSNWPIFSYTDHGELNHGLTFTTRELLQYLYGKRDVGSPLPKQRGATWRTFADWEPDHRSWRERTPLQGEVRTNKKRHGLTLWIGWPPGQVNYRYPNWAFSARCRAKDCPLYGRIRQGYPRVIFDERMNVDGHHVDPFLNAGYVHLWCLERRFDLTRLWADLDIRIDDRVFAKEQANWGKLEKEMFLGIEDVVKVWWRKHSAKSMTIYSSPEYHGQHGNLALHRKTNHPLSRLLVTHATGDEGECHKNHRERSNSDGGPQNDTDLEQYNKRGADKKRKRSCVDDNGTRSSDYEARGNVARRFELEYPRRAPDRVTQGMLPPVTYRFGMQPSGRVEITPFTPGSVPYAPPMNPPPGWPQPVPPQGGISTGQVQCTPIFSPAVPYQNTMFWPNQAAVFNPTAGQQLNNGWQQSFPQQVGFQTQAQTPVLGMITPHQPTVNPPTQLLPDYASAIPAQNQHQLPIELFSPHVAPRQGDGNVSQGSLRDHVSCQAGFNTVDGTIQPTSLHPQPIITTQGSAPGVRNTQGSAPKRESTFQLASTPVVTGHNGSQATARNNSISGQALDDWGLGSMELDDVNFDDWLNELQNDWSIPHDDK